MHGMSSTESGDLKGVMATCEKIAPTAQDFAAATANTGLQADADQAQKLYARAKEVLEYNYPNSGRYQMTPGVNRSNLPVNPGERRVGVGTGTSGGTGPTGR